MSALRPVEQGLPTRQVLAYAALAYAISWACWLPLAFGHQVVVVGGWPTHAPGLLGPAVSAFVVTMLAQGGAGARQLAARVVRWRIGWWWLVAVSPVLMLGASLGALLIVGETLPSLAAYGEINGFPTWGVLGVLALLVVVNGLGEETGWRGYLQPMLQQRLRPLVAMLIVAGIWAGWHAPLFAILTNFRGFDTVTLVGFVIGLACGAIVLGWLYNRTGSVLAVAVWHVTYNLTSATTASHGLPAAVSTTVVIVAAVVLVGADLATHGRVLAPATADSREVRSTTRV